MDYTQCTPTPRKNKHLSLTEWIKIEIMLQEGKTAYAIAKSLQRSINTILHEIRCGSVDQIKAGKKIRIYLADAGQVLRFYEFYISRRYIKKVPADYKNKIHLFDSLRRLRNACAHNNCLMTT